MQIQMERSNWLNQDELWSRSAKEVIEDHIRLQIAGQLEEDLQRNYATDVLLLTDAGHHRGHAEFRATVDKLYRQAPGAYYEMTSLQVQDNCALLIWKAGSSEYAVDCATDSFVVVDGKIRMQTSDAKLMQSDAGAFQAG